MPKATVTEAALRVYRLFDRASVGADWPQGDARADAFMELADALRRELGHEAYQAALAMPVPEAEEVVDGAGYLSVNEAAARARVAPNTIRHWIDRKELSAVQLPNRRWRIDPRELSRVLTGAAS